MAGDGGDVRRYFILILKEFVIAALCVGGEGERLMQREREGGGRDFFLIFLKTIEPKCRRNPFLLCACVLMNNKD